MQLFDCCLSKVLICTPWCLSRGLVYFRAQKLAFYVWIFVQSNKVKIKDKEALFNVAYLKKTT